ncbi:hypothetical protein B296_00012335 [Ensete ventricosum]|uniref:Uncharacterized protein n=1 Tax=Ensete ventricosum TaxID=4639 RepID=A0A427B3F5_ENSVE|nr:hypothetical protein B296_00012335 [Ensete ventricosum]
MGYACLAGPDLQGYAPTKLTWISSDFVRWCSKYAQGRGVAVPTDGHHRAAVVASVPRPAFKSFDGVGSILYLLQDDELFLRTMISGMEKVYLSRNPTANAILELVRKDDGDHICYDHFAFRTFGVHSTMSIYLHELFISLPQ